MPEYHHICFVSDQNVAELLGGLLPGRKADHLHAIATPQMALKGEWLRQACKTRGLRCDIHKLEQIAIAEIEELLDQIWLGQPDAAWAVNITGGTKIMSLTAYAWAARNGITAFYIDTGKKNIQLCNADKWREEALPDILGFADLLGLYGYEVRKKTKEQVPSTTREALKKMIDLLSEKNGAKPFHALNGLAQEAINDPDLIVEYWPDARLERLLDICKGAAKLDCKNSYIHFEDEQARAWCNGIWLEEFAQSILAGLEAEGKISSWAASVDVAGNKVANELDAVFTAGNRLYVLECKTSSMASGAPATSILYKADSLIGRVGGIFAQSMLCSIDPLNQADAARAKDMGIRTVIGPNLKNLRKTIMEWIN